MAGNLLANFLSLLEHQERGKVSLDQMVGLLSLYTLLHIVEFLQQDSEQRLQVPVEAPAARTTESALDKALSAVLDGAGGEQGQALANIARALGKNPATIMSLINLLGGERKEGKSSAK